MTNFRRAHRSTALESRPNRHRRLETNSSEVTPSDSVSNINARRTLTANRSIQANPASPPNVREPRQTQPTREHTSRSTEAYSENRSDNADPHRYTSYRTHANRNPVEAWLESQSSPNRGPSHVSENQPRRSSTTREPRTDPTVNENHARHAPRNRETPNAIPRRSRQPANRSNPSPTPSTPPLASLTLTTELLRNYDISTLNLNDQGKIVVDSPFELLDCIIKLFAPSSRFSDDITPNLLIQDGAFIRSPTPNHSRLQMRSPRNMRPTSNSPASEQTNELFSLPVPADNSDFTASSRSLTRSEELLLNEVGYDSFSEYLTNLRRTAAARNGSPVHTPALVLRNGEPNYQDQPPAPDGYTSLPSARHNGRVRIRSYNMSVIPPSFHRNATQHPSSDSSTPPPAY